MLEDTSAHLTRLVGESKTKRKVREPQTRNWISIISFSVEKVVELLFYKFNWLLGFYFFVPEVTTDVRWQINKLLIIVMEWINAEPFHAKESCNGCY